MNKVKTETMYEPRTPATLRNRIFNTDTAEFKKDKPNNWNFKPKRGKKKAGEMISFAIIKPAFGKFIYRGEPRSWSETLEAVKADGHSAYRQGSKGNIIKLWQK